VARKKAAVRWQDGTTDAYGDNYKEITGSGYADFMEKNAPFGRDDYGNYLESPSSNPDLLSDEDVVTEGSPLPDLSWEILQEALKTLTPKQLQVWKLIVQEQYTEEEAGDLLGVSQQAVHKNYAAANAKVTNYLLSQKHRVDGQDA
jgi:DNA-directed RNA polymerase specialized sigma24 family protein